MEFSFNLTSPRLGMRWIFYILRDDLIVSNLKIHSINFYCEKFRLLRNLTFAVFNPSKTAIVVVGYGTRKFF